MLLDQPRQADAAMALAASMAGDFEHRWVALKLAKFVNQEIQPPLFEIAFLPGPQIRFRLQFNKLGDAVKFAKNLDGKVLNADANVADA